MLMANRLVAGFVAVALLGVGVAPCAGWESTAQARHDCCVEGQCPGQFERAGHGTDHADDMTQAQADRCCATSEQQNQSRSTQFVGTAFLLAPPVERLVALAEDIRPPDRLDPHAVPVLSPPARLHLLFSVFLV
jgi:hypothetical protein